MNKQLTGEKNGKPTQLKMLCSNLNPRQSMTPMKLILSRIYSSTLPFHSLFTLWVDPMTSRTLINTCMSVDYS